MVKALVLDRVSLRGMFFFTQQLRAAASILPRLTSPPNFAAPITTSLILPCDQKCRKDYSTSSYFCLPKLIRCGRVTENTPRDSCVAYLSRACELRLPRTPLCVSARPTQTHTFVFWGGKTDSIGHFEGQTAWKCWPCCRLCTWWCARLRRR